MTTAAYISQFLSTHQTGLPYEGFFRWCHEHPTLNKVIEIAAMIFGGALIAGGYTIGSWTVTLLGVAIGVIAAIAFVFLQILAPSHHDMKTHVFQTGSCVGGELYYHGDLPILKIDGRDPRRAGFAQGYLLGESIHKITSRFALFLHTFLRQPRAEDLTEFLTQVKATLPQEYLTEMEGLVSGYNTWAQEQGWTRPKDMTLDETLLIHLMPDLPNLVLGGIARNPFLRTEPVMGCTSILDRDPERGVLFGRNMDWPSLDLTGQYSLIKQVDRGAVRTVEVTVPGMIGALTGMNNHGFSLAMNICAEAPPHQVRGMPAVFYNRRCLESCRTVDDMAQMPSTPLTAYHLTVADPNNGASFHFYQGNERARLLRNDPLATFNRTFGGPYTNFDVHFSSLRAAMWEHFYSGIQEGMDRAELMEAAVRLPGINNFETTHTVIMEPRARRMRVAFDNGFSANNPLHEVPIAELFGQEVSQSV